MRQAAYVNDQSSFGSMSISCEDFLTMAYTTCPRRRIWHAFTLTLVGENPFSGIVYVGATDKAEPNVAKLIRDACERGVSEFLSLFADEIRLDMEPRSFRTAQAARLAAREIMLDHIACLGADKVLNRTHLGSGYWSTIRGLKQARTYLLKARRAKEGLSPGAGRPARPRAPSGVPYDVIGAARDVGLDPLALVWLMWAAPSTPTPAALAIASRRSTGRLQIFTLALAHVMRERGARADMPPSIDDEATAEELASLERILIPLRQAWESARSTEMAAAAVEPAGQGASELE
jgi:hypothetical protein